MAFHGRSPFLGMYQTGMRLYAFRTHAQFKTVPDSTELSRVPAPRATATMHLLPGASLLDSRGPLGLWSQAQRGPELEVPNMSSLLHPREGESQPSPCWRRSLKCPTRERKVRRRRMMGTRMRRKKRVSVWKARGKRRKWTD